MNDRSTTTTVLYIMVSFSLSLLPFFLVCSALLLLTGVLAQSSSRNRHWPHPKIVYSRGPWERRAQTSLSCSALHVVYIPLPFQCNAMALRCMHAAVRTMATWGECAICYIEQSKSSPFHLDLPWTGAPFHSLSRTTPPTFFFFLTHSLSLHVFFFLSDVVLFIILFYLNLALLFSYILVFCASLFSLRSSSISPIFPIPMSSRTKNTNEKRRR